MKTKPADKTQMLNPPALVGFTRTSSLMKWFFLMLIVSSGYLSAESNLLDNPSFEVQKDSGDDLPESWDVVKKGTFEQSHFSDTQTVLDGKYSARLVNEKPELAGAQIIWMQKNLGPKLMEIPDGAEIEFSVYARSEKAGATCHIYVESMSAGKVWGKTVALQPGRWEKIQVLFDKEDIHLGSAYVCLRLVGNGDIVFDKAYLGIAANAPKELKTETDSAGNRIANGSMELVDATTGEVQNWSFSSKDPEAKGSLDKTMADTGANSLCMESADPQQSVYWIQHDITPRLSDCPPGTEMLLSLRANTGGEAGVKFQFYIEMMKKGKFIGTFISKPEGVDDGWDTKSLKFKMPEEVPDQASLVIRLLTPGKVWFDDVRLVKAGADLAP